MFNKIFISYASEDYSAAKGLYDNLLEKNYSPWLDKEKLQVGSNWDFKIRQALKESDFVIILLSSISIKKRGFVQREFKLALKYLEDKLIDDIYIIPILLNDCEVPAQLESIQWIKSSEENYLGKILDSINIQRKIYFDTTPQEIIDLQNSFISQKLDVIQQVRKHVDCHFEYPVFAKNNFWNVSDVNDLVKSKALEIRNGLYNFYFSDKEYFEWEGVEFRDSTLTYTISSITENQLSILFTHDDYLGGAHPNSYYYTLNFLFNPDYLIEPKMFINDPDLKKIVTTKKYQSYEFEDDEVVDISSHLENYSYNIEFTLRGDKIEIILANNLPRVIQVCGFFTTSYKIQDHKIELILD